MHGCITVDAEVFTCSSCGTVWVARIPLSNREIRDVSKFFTEGLKRMPLLSSWMSVAKSRFLWGLWWEEIRKNRDAFWENYTQLYCSGADTKMPPGQERKAEERTVSSRLRYKTPCSLFLSKVKEPLITASGSPKVITSSWELELLYSKTTGAPQSRHSISPIYS